MMSSINIIASYYPWQVRFLGAISLFASVFVYEQAWWWAFVLVAIGILLLTGHSRTLIDRERKTFMEYYAYMFMKTGKERSYQGFEKIFINATQKTERMHTAHMDRTAIFNSTQYNAYLKLDSGEKILLTQKKNKEKLIKQIQPIADYLQTQLVDTTLN